MRVDPSNLLSQQLDISVPFHATWLASIKRKPLSLLEQINLQLGSREEGRCMTSKYLLVGYIVVYPIYSCFYKFVIQSQIQSILPHLRSLFCVAQFVYCSPIHFWVYC